VVIGPGSWFTSVLSHVLVPDLAQALRDTSARRILVLNAGPQAGETQDFTATRYLETWAALAPGISLDAVLADPRSVDDLPALERAADNLGAMVVLADVLAGPGHHDQGLLAAALEGLL
jgi:uncharacterized cofD-like protein